MIKNFTKEEVQELEILNMILEWIDDPAGRESTAIFGNKYEIWVYVRVACPRWAIYERLDNVKLKSLFSGDASDNLTDAKLDAAKGFNRLARSALENAKKTLKTMQELEELSKEILEMEQIEYNKKQPYNRYDTYYSQTSSTC